MQFSRGGKRKGIIRGGRMCEDIISFVFSPVVGGREDRREDGLLTKRGTVRLSLWISWWGLRGKSMDGGAILLEGEGATATKLWPLVKQEPLRFQP